MKTDNIINPAYPGAALQNSVLKNSENDHTISVLYTTFSTQEAAEILARHVMLKKLAACVNILPGGLSIYLWKGNIERNNDGKASNIINPPPPA